MLKRILAVLCCFGIIFSFSCCTADKKKGSEIQIVCSTFPVYDWTKNILKDCNDINISLLLNSAADLHSYQATAKDIVTVSSSDIFIYIGGDSDKWAEDILKNSKGKTVSINLFHILGEENLYCPEETAEEHDSHSHSHSHGHHHNFDEHIWLSPLTALKVTKKLSEALSLNLPQQKETISKSYREYEKQLQLLDDEYKKVVSESKNDTLLIADRNPFLYLLNDYSLHGCAAFTGCSAESEASAHTLIKLIDKIKELSLGYIIITETSNGDIARTLKSNLPQINTEILTLHSLQSLKGNIDEISYLELMRENCTVLKKVLS